MTGRFKNFNEDRGFGFILGEDGNDYFAHISEVKSVELPYRGATVEFTPSQNDKGLSAKKILVQKAQPNRPNFIQIANYRFKLSNIKTYALVSRRNGAYLAKSGEWVYYDERFPVGTHLYLDISLYSGDEYTFCETQNNIREIAQQLDELFGMAK